MKYLGRPKVCCGNCLQWFDRKSFSDGDWGKCMVVGLGRHTINITIIDDEEKAIPTHEGYWCCHFRLKETAIKFQLTKEVELIE